MTLNLADPILDAAPGIYFMFDAEGRLAGWNRAYLETFNLTPAAMEQFRALDVVALDHQNRAKQAIDTILSGKPVTMELDFIVADGRRRTFYGTGIPAEHEGRRHVTGLIIDITERKLAEEQQRRSHDILTCVSRLLGLYVSDGDAALVFDSALTDILRLTGSQYGFIAEQGHDADGAPFLQALAISNIALDEASRRFYDEHADSGFRFNAMDTLAVAAMVSGTTVIANDPANDPRSCGRLPAGHPPLDTFMGLPLIRGTETLGSIGLANRDEGYDGALAEELRPVVEACARLVEALHNRRAQRQAEMALRERERELDSIVENIPNMIFLKDATTLRFVRFNRAGEKMMGVSREALLGRSDYDLVPKEQADFYTDCDRQVLASNVPLDIPEEAHTTLAGTRTLHTRKVCIRGDDGQPRYLLGIAEDISERKRQADVLRLYERMVSCMPDHISILDRDYRYLAINDTYLKHHNLPREAIVGHSVAELLGQSVFDNLVKAKLDRCLAGEKVQYSDWFDFQATGHRFVDVTYTPYQDDNGQIIGVIVASRDITDLKQAHQALVTAESRYRMMVESTRVVVWEMPLPPKTFSYVSPHAEQLLGYPLAQWYEPDFWAAHIHPDDRDYAVRVCYGSTARDIDHESEYRMLAKDGSIQWVQEIATIIRAEDGSPLRLSGVLVDISERRQTQEKLRQAAVVFDNAQEGIMVTDQNARILAVNPAFCEITGYDEAEVIGATPAKFKSGRHDVAFYQAMWDTLIQTGRWQGEVWDRRKNGEVYPKWLSISTVRDANGETMHYVSLFADITHLKESEARLEHLAHFDVLTDLPNRLLFYSRLEHALDQAKRHQQRLAVLFIDLDRFKTVNDSLGHPAGDELLISVAQRIRKRLRSEDTLARLGGDEFVILLEQMDDAQIAAVVAQNVLQVLSAPVHLSGGHEVFIGGSIGISLYPDDADDATRLVSSADAALYQAKEQGRNTYCFYTNALTTAANDRLALETRLRYALERGEFVLHYQPLIDTQSGKPIGVEALVRWQPPGKAMVEPGHFIPIAEDTGLIVPLGEWVLRTACAQARTWQNDGLPPLVMAVNLSGRQFQSEDMVALVRTVLVDTGLPAQYLELELTESIIMEHADQAIATLDALKALGVRLAIDDFGTGYSSLAYLKRFPIDKLKIDRSFVDGLADDADDREIATTIIAMARSLNLDVLAEGVETQQQLDILRGLGCGAYQGYLFSRPVPAEALSPLLLR